MIQSQHDAPEIEKEQVQYPPNLTDDTRPQREREARYGMSVPIMIAIVGVIFLLIIIGAVVATR